MLLVGILAVLAFFTLGGTSGEAGSRPGNHAALRVANVSPFAVTGLGFKPGERVRITAESRRKSAVAGPRGRFWIRFAAVDPCNGIVVTAVGNEGSRASIAFNATWRVHCAAP